MSGKWLELLNADGPQAAARRRHGDAGPAVRRRPPDRCDAAAGEHPSLPAADLRHQSRLRAQGALRRQPELDADRRYAARRKRGAAATADVRCWEKET